MKIKLLTIVYCLSFICSSAMAQEEMFKVLASKGANKVVSANSPDQKPVLIGKKLYKDDKIIVAENSYLGLAHKSGKTIELKKAGTYEVSRLYGEVANQNAGVAKKYVDFVSSEMTSKDEDMVKNRYKYMAVTGSVKRDVAPIVIKAPENTYALSAPVLIRWKSLSADSSVSYVLLVTDLADETVFTAETKDTQYVVDLEKLNFKKEKNFIYKVYHKYGLNQTPPVESSRYILKYVEDERAEEVEKQTAALKEALSEETALNKVVLASFYEEKGLILDAMYSYEAAIAMEPEVEDYKTQYTRFIERNKLNGNAPKKPAKKN